jgi:hypothetical protein
VNKAQQVPPPKPEPASQPALAPTNSPSQSPAQQANGELAAALAAQVQAIITAKGFEYQSELPWKAVVLCGIVAAICLVIVALHEGGDLLEAKMKHREEMARITNAESHKAR